MALNESDFEFAPSWSPNPGEILERGRIVDVSAWDAGYGPYPVFTFELAYRQALRVWDRERNAPGDPVQLDRVAWHAKGKVAPKQMFRALGDADPIGRVVSIRYGGYVKTPDGSYDGYHDWQVRAEDGVSGRLDSTRMPGVAKDLEDERLDLKGRPELPADTQGLPRPVDNIADAEVVEERRSVAEQAEQAADDDTPF
jgi:hypothetical protein